MISGPKGPLFEEDRDMGCPICKDRYSLRIKTRENSAVWIHCNNCGMEFAVRPEAVPTWMKNTGE